MQLLDNRMLDALTTEALKSPRKRAHLNIHQSLEEPVQRLFIAIEPGSYVQPHRHPEKEKWEFFWVVRGRLVALFFDEQGRVSRREELTPTGPVHGFEIPPNTWHTVAALEPGSVFLEVKQGPYTPMTDKGFASWAPREGEPSVGAFCSWLVDARPGDLPPAK